MKPKIKDALAWKQAEMLMQPTLIRVIDNIRKQLENSPWKGTYQQIQTPTPGYRLDLSCNDITRSVDIWDVCYQVCFLEYEPTHAAGESREVEIDTSLIDNETAEVDWNNLDAKAKRIVEQLLAPE
ncbi:MAG: hypothetical protein WBA13_15775 [Microcoleaceae cyanobacterium]